MGTIKELLILLREFLPGNINKRMAGSICYTIYDMNYDKLITDKEERLLLKYIDDHCPIKDPDYTGFWWPYGELEPRLEFLDKLIAEIDEN